MAVVTCDHQTRKLVAGRRVTTETEVATLLEEYQELKDRTGKGIAVLMDGIDERETDGWQRGFAQWAQLDQEYRLLVAKLAAMGIDEP